MGCNLGQGSLSTACLLSGALLFCRRWAASWRCDAEIQLNKCYECLLHTGHWAPEAANAALPLGSPRWTHGPHQVTQICLNREFVPCVGAVRKGAAT